MTQKVYLTNLGIMFLFMGKEVDDFHTLDKQKLFARISQQHRK